MRPLLLSLFFYLFNAILFIQLTYAQELINQMDANGKRIGIWKAYYENGSIRYEGFFRNDRPQGLFKYFDENGWLKATNSFDRTGRKALHRAFDSTGFIVAEGIYLNQKRDSIWTFYSAEDSAVIARETYQIGQKHGLSVTYYPKNGEKAEELHYVKDELNGAWKKYFEDGTLMTSGFYENDKLNGPFTTYHPNGQINIKGQYVNDLQYGVWEFYDADGNVINSEKYQMRE